MEIKTLPMVERKILANQFRILSKIEENSEYYENRAEILEYGYTGQYHEVFEEMWDETTMEICNETSEILNMYRRIDNAFKSLKDSEISDADIQKIKFEGFDANNDSHYHYCAFMIEKMNLWQEHKDIYLNSHSQLPLMKYRKMLKCQSDILIDNKNDFDEADLIKLIGVI